MRVRFRASFGNWLTGGLHIVILVLAAQARSAAVWPYALAAMSVLSFAAWIGNYRRLRHIADTPTSRVASAAQGYAELIGRADRLPGDRLAARLSGRPCAWYRYQIDSRTSDDKWSHEESGESDDPFLLVDDTGQCVVDPDGAEIITSHCKVWTSGGFRYTEWLLLPHDSLYAIGAFATVGGANSHLDADADVSALLGEWKSNRPRLLARFDLDRDGELDLEEWDLARRQAQREVAGRHREIRAGSGTHFLRAPADGRLFLISNYLPDKLHRRYHIWSWVHIVIFVGAAGAAIVLL